MSLTEFERDCIRFYMGDPDVVLRGDFLGGPKAYNTINAFLHEGIVNELDKIREHKPIEVFSRAHLKQIVSVILTIDQAMKKCSFENSPLISYRVDRVSEVDAMQEKKQIEGFYSTCKYGFLKEYANTKQNVVLMEIRRDSDVLCLDFEALFQSSYAKQEEAEILLAYDSIVKEIRMVECSEEENKRYLDMNGNPPCAKVLVHIGKRKELDLCEEPVFLDDVTNDECAERISRILKELTDRQMLTDDDEIYYLNWKRKLKRALKSAA